MTETRELYYRLHWADCPEFSAANAWSGLWGAERSEDGSRSACGCDGYEDCANCGGTGWLDCVPGYSACLDAAELVQYMDKHFGDVKDDDGAVIVFTGRVAGTGFDGEPCVVPSEVVETLTWAEFVARRIA